MINPSSFLIYGGINEARKFVSTPVSYDMSKKTVNVLTEVGDAPPERLRCGLLSTGANMNILYGGVHLKVDGYYTDLWHLTVNDNTITYTEVEYLNEDTHFFMTWRHGFTLHYVRNINDPILIGGTYGNNQQARVLISLPEKKCKSEREYISTTCSPCPRGSVIRNNKCEW